MSVKFIVGGWRQTIQFSVKASYTRTAKCAAYE